ncbi:hypothetical protein AVEN_129607-1 [Araneus ventricosus]|uniref:Uncharacterized protein n=1 Tax=Araneus ventricosus TaxID=182803 RepID=A0A4Y2LU69_ARAVE|nr:hypothetical protein AVEN_129607-1 [Araneus ventricosus]
MLRNVGIGILGPVQIVHNTTAYPRTRRLNGTLSVGRCDTVLRLCFYDPDDKVECYCCFTYHGLHAWPLEVSEGRGGLVVSFWFRCRRATNSKYDFTEYPVKSGLLHVKSDVRRQTPSSSVVPKFGEVRVNII